MKWVYTFENMETGAHVRVVVDAETHDEGARKAREEIRDLAERYKPEHVG